MICIKALVGGWSDHSTVGHTLSTQRFENEDGAEVSESEEKGMNKGPVQQLSQAWLSYL